ncbi:alpha/beta hydrolase [Chitinophagaceae bacterium IBVUCB1]|nr:alpha/beta hydrolase [Chitinophagaceae bacterium IBVUCB1]
MKHLILLHGAIGAKDQLAPLADALKDTYTVHSLSFAGHGGEPFPQSFSIAVFATDVLRYMDACNIMQADVFGYSMGGYVAMYIARHHADRIGKIATLATKFYWDEATAHKETAMLDAEKIAAKLPAFANALAKRHSPNDWKEVLQHTITMLHAMGQDTPLQIEDYANIQHPCLLLLGDRDKMITLDETLAVYKALPNAQMGMLPDTPHPIEQVSTTTLAWMLKQFIA